MAERRSSRRRAPEPESGTDSHNDSYDADSLESDPRERGKGRGPEGLSRLRTSAPSTSRRENVRVWPLCFAIAIEKTVRVRPAVMVASSSLLAWVTYYLQESDLELTLRAWISSPLVVFILVECLFLLCAFFVLMPHTMRQAYKDDKRTAFKVADSAVLSALPPSVARFAVGSGVAWKRAALAVARDGALFFTLYLLCVEALVGGEDEVAYIPGMKNGITRTTGGEKDGWREMDGGYSVHSWVKSSDADGD